MRATPSLFFREFAHAHPCVIKIYTEDGNIPFPAIESRGKSAVNNDSNNRRDRNLRYDIMERRIKSISNDVYTVIRRIISSGEYETYQKSAYTSTELHSSSRNV